jgi:hypothetical protein
VDRWQEIHNVNAGPCRIKLATRMEAVPVPLARPVGGGHFCLPGPNGPPTGPKGQPFPQPGPKALEGDPHNIPSGPTGRPFRDSGVEKANGWPVGPTNVVLGAIHGPIGGSHPLPSPMGWAGGMPGPLGLQIVVAGRSTGRCCVPVHIPVLPTGPSPVALPTGPHPDRPARPGVCGSCLPGPNGPRPAQRASHSPSQGRRHWRWTSIGNHEVSSAKALWSPQRDQYSPIDQPTTQERHGSVVAQTRCGEDHPGHRPCRLVSNWLVGALKATPPRSIASA